jgi:ankyrin repeat protein
MNVIQLLLDHRANPLLQNSDGLSALFMCCEHGHVNRVNIIKLLYKYGARDELLCLPDGGVYSVINRSCVGSLIHGLFRKEGRGINSLRAWIGWRMGRDYYSNWGRHHYKIISSLPFKSKTCSQKSQDLNSKKNLFFFDDFKFAAEEKRPSQRYASIHPLILYKNEYCKQSRRDEEI